MVLILLFCFCVYIYFYMNVCKCLCLYALQWHIHLILMSSVQHFVFTEQVFLLTLYFKVDFFCVCESVSLYCDPDKPSEINNNEWKMNKITSNPVDVLFI